MFAQSRSRVGATLRRAGRTEKGGVEPSSGSSSSAASTCDSRDRLDRVTSFGRIFFPGNPWPGGHRINASVASKSGDR